MEKQRVHLFLCSSPLQAVHAHMLRSQCPDFAQDEALFFYEPRVSTRLVQHDLWSEVVALQSSKREFGNAPRNIRENLKQMRCALAYRRRHSINLVIDSLFWLMNNVAAASLRSWCLEQNISFSLSILDEGAILYTTKRMSWKRLFRCWGRSAYLLANGLRSVVITSGSADYRHPLCTALYCLHPELLSPPSRIRVVRLRAEWLEPVYGGSFEGFEFPASSCLYLSQPLSGQIGVDQQAELVLACRRFLERKGIVNFFFKAHHFDDPKWLDVLEKRCGFGPVPWEGTLPVELLAARCNADAIFSHFSSALLNLRFYGYKGNILCFGLEQLRGTCLGESEFREYSDIARQLSTVEIVDP